MTCSDDIREALTIPHTHVPPTPHTPTPHTHPPFRWFVHLPREQSGVVVVSVVEIMRADTDTPTLSYPTTRSILRDGRK